MMTCPCRMQSYLCKQMGLNIIYLSLMHLTQRVISGSDIPDTNEKLINLNPQEREQVWAELRDELKYNAVMYMYRAMKKLGGGDGCILAAHQFE